MAIGPRLPGGSLGAESHCGLRTETCVYKPVLWEGVQGCLFQGLLCEGEALTLHIPVTNQVLFCHCKRRNKVLPVSTGSPEPHRLHFCTKERVWEHSAREEKHCLSRQNTETSRSRSGGRGEGWSVYMQVTDVTLHVSLAPWR